MPTNAALRLEADSELERNEAELLALEATYCSHGDTVHYTDFPKIFDRCEGSYMFDAAGSRSCRRRNDAAFPSASCRSASHKAPCPARARRMGPLM